MIIETIVLDSGHSITLLDQTRHYFGGYFHVKVLACCTIPLLRDYFEDDSEFNDAVTKMGESVRFERVLEKMAVPDSDIETVREQLTCTFRETAKEYLSSPGFVPRFVRSEYQKRLKKSSRNSTLTSIMCHYPS